jgi:hypothetical protein
VEAFQGFQDSKIMEGNTLLSTTLKASGAKGFQRFSENRLAQSDARGLFSSGLAPIVSILSDFLSPVLSAVSFE